MKKPIPHPEDEQTHNGTSAYQQFIRQKRFSGSKSHKRLGLVVTLCCLVLSAAIVAVLFLHEKPEQDAYIYNVSVCGISLQGLTTKEATALLDTHAKELLPTDPIVVKILDTTLTLTNEDTHAHLNTAAMATAAYLHGRDSQSDGAQPITLDPNDFVELEPNLVRAILIEAVQPYNGRPVETTITVTGERPDLTKEPQENEPMQVMTIQLGTPKYLCDPDTIFRSILDAHKRRQFEIVGQVKLIEPEKLSAASIFYKYCVYPINATIDPDTFVISKSVYGFGFDINTLQKELDAAQWGDTIEIALSRIKPSITTEMLQASPF